jgi:hypothetical protein
MVDLRVAVPPLRMPPASHLAAMFADSFKSAVTG